MLVVAMSFFSCNALEFVSINNQECKVRPKIININSNELLQCSCNKINHPHTKLCVSDVIKCINVKVFNLMSRTNETKHRELHETCEWECRLDASVCSNKQRCNNDKCRCECKELIDKGICDKGFIWNLSNCDKSCDVGEYLDYYNCKGRKKLIDKLVEECIENINEKELHSSEMIYSSTLNDCEKCVIFVQYTLYYLL